MNRKSFLLSMAMVMVIGFGIVGEGKAAPTEQPKKATRATKASAASRWDTVLQAAKREGALVIYTSANPATKQALAKAFRDKYGITVDFIGGRGEEQVQRIVTENRAGLYLGDLMIGGSLQLTLQPTGTMATLDSALILPEVADPAQWRGNKFPFSGKDHQIVNFINQTASHVAVNNDSVKPGEIKAYRDLLDPKWKGKIVMDDPTVVGAADQWSQVMQLLFGPEKGKEYLQQIAKQEPVVLRDRRLVVEWLARNRYPIAVGLNLQTYSEFKANGASIAYLRMSEGNSSTAGGGCVAMLKRAAHPNAALVFLNWLLTKEGQTIFQKAYGMPSARLDVDKTGMEPAFIPQEGENLIFASSDEWYTGVPGRRAIVKQIFGPLMK